MDKREYKQLSCREAGADCDFLVRAETEDEVLSLAGEHSCRAHGACEITSDQKERIRSFIKSVFI